MKDAQNQQDKIDEMKIILEVNKQAETFYDEAKKLGNMAAKGFGEDHRAQLTGLENIAESTFKTSDVFDYVKRQSARHDHWRKENFGKQLLDQLEQLANKRRTICTRLGISDKTDEGQQEWRRIHLLLIRQFIRQLVIEYEFRVKFDKREEDSGTH